MSKTFVFDPRNPEFYNPIINSNFDFWQRLSGTSVTRTQALANGGYGADRTYSAVSVGGSAKSITIQRSTSIPNTIIPASFSHQVTNNTAIATYAAGEFIDPYEHNLEGLYFRPFAGRPITLGFWIFASVPGVYAAAVRRNISTRAYVSTVTVNAANTWEYKTVQIPWDTGGAAQVYDTSARFSILIGAVTGTTFNASSLNTWLAGDAFSHSSVTNWTATAGAVLRIAQVQLRLGYRTLEEMRDGYVPFAPSYNEELVACQRYLFAIICVNGGNNAIGISGQASGATLMQPNFIIPTPMRVPPVVSGGGVQINAVNAGTSVAISSFTVGGSPQTTDVQSCIFNANTAGLTTGLYYRLEWPGGTPAGARLTFDAEF